jgi:hypothetical protein
MGDEDEASLVLAVASGGALGFVARYLIAIGAGPRIRNVVPIRDADHMTGSALTGASVSLFAIRWNLPEIMRAFSDGRHLWGTRPSQRSLSMPITWWCEGKWLLRLRT